VKKTFLTLFDIASKLMFCAFFVFVYFMMNYVIYPMQMISKLKTQFLGLLPFSQRTRCKQIPLHEQKFGQHDMVASVYSCVGQL
jgi:hypothetical protein